MATNFLVISEEEVKINELVDNNAVFRAALGFASGCVNYLLLNLHYRTSVDASDISMIFVWSMVPDR